MKHLLLLVFPLLLLTLLAPHSLSAQTPSKIIVYVDFTDAIVTRSKAYFVYVISAQANEDGLYPTTRYSAPNGNWESLAATKKYLGFVNSPTEAIMIGRWEKVENSPSYDRGDITESRFMNKDALQHPQYPGGDTAMYRFLESHIKYPDHLRREGVQGKVYVGFVVLKDGSVSQVQVYKGVDPELDAEAMRVVKMMPRWSPGMKYNRPVSVEMVVPINFKLSEFENPLDEIREFFLRFQ
ncbi:MAG: energy transducer TonB [Bacteroidota bacterium]